MAVDPWKYRPIRGEKYVSEGHLSYGLIISETDLILVSYDDIGRTQSIVESDSVETIIEV